MSKRLNPTANAPRGKVGPPPPSTPYRILVSKRDKARIYANVRRNGVAGTALRIYGTDCMCLVGAVANVQFGDPLFGYHAFVVDVNVRESEDSMVARAAQSFDDAVNHGWVSYNDRWIRDVRDANVSAFDGRCVSRDPRVIEAWIAEVAERALTTKPPLTRRLRTAIRRGALGKG